MNKIMINIGPINITWYAFFIVMSMIIGLFIVKNNKNIKKEFIKKDQIFDLFFGVIVSAIIGARIWYVIFSFDLYINNLFQIFAIWNGGLAIHGGIIGGLLYIIYYSKKNAINFLTITDAIIPALLLGQSIGRWGNFVNQEAHGPKTTYEFLKNTLHLPDFIVNGMNINGVYYQPTFLYESIWNFIGFLIVVLILNKIWSNKIGYISSFYLIWYGTIRFFIEILRTDALMFFNIKIAQLTSFVMIVIGVIAFFIFRKYNLSKDKSSHFPYK